MSLLELYKIELMKTKRSKILPILMIAPILVVISGVSSIGLSMTSEYTNAWAAMFIQSALLFGYYLLPFSMVIVCIMISNREMKNNGILKMLALPINKGKMALSKFLILVSYLIVEIFVFFLAFIIAGSIMTHTKEIQEAVPALYILSWSLKLLLTMIPALSLMWLLTILLEKPLLSMGLNLLLIIPGVLVGTTPIWFIYPYCYSGYVVSDALHTVTKAGGTSNLSIFPFVPCAIIITLISLAGTYSFFGRKEAN